MGDWETRFYMKGRKKGVRLQNGLRLTKIRSGRRNFLFPQLTEDPVTSPPNPLALLKRYSAGGALLREIPTEGAILSFALKDRTDVIAEKANPPIELSDEEWHARVSAKAWAQACENALLNPAPVSR